MATIAQINANRANAQFSTGPRTPEGRRKVGRNRISHGLTGRAVLIPGEDPAEFDALAFRMAIELAPGTAVEESLVRNLTNIQWRLDRIAAWIGLLTAEAIEGDPGLPSRLMRMFSRTGNPCDALERLHRHEASLNRQYSRALRDFHRSKQERSKILAGKNPAAVNDIAELLQAAAEVFGAHGVPIRQNRDSNPISGPQPAPTAPENPSAPAAPAANPPAGPGDTQN